MNYEYDTTGKLVNPITIKCAYCGDEFESYHPTAKYCSVKCRSKANYKGSQTYAKKCLVCGKDFETKQKNTKYCSSYCSNRRPKEFKLKCQMCGKDFIGKCDGVKYCSSECRQTTHNNICTNCGKEFTTKVYKKACCSDECVQEIRRKTGKTTGNQYGDEKQREKRFKKSFEKKYPNFKYHSGFISVDDYFNFECKICGHIQSRNAVCVRPSRNKEIRCDGCIEAKKVKIQKAKEEKRISKEVMDVIRSEVKALKRIKYKHKKTKVCSECGRTFFTTKKSITCSTKCQNKRTNRLSEIKRRSKLKDNGKINWDISLDKLIKRDKNTCYICGGQCDKNDYEINDKGHFIVGKNYPSTDHVKPVAKGGTHTWENIKLAHHYCNTIKRDNTTYENNDRQMVMAI